MVDPSREGHLRHGLLDMFDGLTRRYDTSGAQVVARLLVDHIMLLYQLPMYVTLWKREQGSWHQAHSSISDADRSFFGIRKVDPPPRKGGIEDAHGSRYIAKGELAVSIRALPSSRTRHDETFEKLRCNGSAATVERLLSMYQESFGHLPDATDTLIDPLDASPTALHSHDKILQKRIERELVRLRRVGADQRAHSAMLFFPIVRYSLGERVVRARSGAFDRKRAHSAYDFSPRLFLDPSENDELRRPLGDDERSIACTPLSRGNIDFSYLYLESRASAGVSWTRQVYREDSTRRELELAYYRRQLGTTPDSNVFFVPIHMSGVPWLALLTLSRRYEDGKGLELGDIESNIKLRNYLVYRDLVPVLSERLNLGAQSAFIESMTLEMNTQMSEHLGRNTSIESFIEATNARWQDVSRIYPFAAPRITLDETPFILEETDGRRLCIDAITPSGANLTAFAGLDIAIVGDALRSRLKRIREASLATTLAAHTTFAHEIGTIFRAANLEGFHPQTAAEARMKMLLMHARDLAGASKMLKNFSLPQPWRTPRAIAYGEIEHALAKLVMWTIGLSLEGRVLQSLPGSSPLATLHCSNGGVESLTCAKLAEMLMQPRPVLPPFPSERAGEANTGIIAAGLTELVTNAVRAVASDLTQGALLKVFEKQGVPLIEIHISPAPSESGAVLVRVRNLSMRLRDASSTTVELIRRLEHLAMRFSGEHLSVAETSPARVAVDGEDSSETSGLRWVEASWFYRYGLLVEAHHGGKGDA